MNVTAEKMSDITDFSAPGLEVIEGGCETTPDRPALGSLALLSMSRSRADCMLGDVDDLSRYVSEDGLSYEPHAVDSVKQNKVTAVKEGAIPYARSKAEHKWKPSLEGRGGTIMDLGRTAVQTAMRGRLFYQHPESLARGDVEVEYARHNQESLRPGIAHVIIEPKMTRKDGPLEVAKSEGLADTDSIQVNWLRLGDNQEPEASLTEAILAPDVPIEAWVDMLADSNNIFGKSIIVEDPESALSVMQAFRELVIPIEKLTEGPVSILDAVLPHISDVVAYQQVARHIEQFRINNQQGLHERALSPAERWLQFDMATEQSLRAGLADTQLQSFIESLDEQWNDEDRAIINSHKVTNDGQIQYRMTRKLAAILQNAERNFILTATAVVSGNKEVLKQMSPVVAKRIHQAELILAVAQANGVDVQHMAAQNNRYIALQNIQVGRGCSGVNVAKFRIDGTTTLDDIMNPEIPDVSEPSNNEVNSWHGGRITKGKCVNCNEKKEVGVKSWCQECISGHCGSKTTSTNSKPSGSGSSLQTDSRDNITGIFSRNTKQPLKLSKPSSADTSWLGSKKAA